MHKILSLLRTINDKHFLRLRADDNNNWTVCAEYTGDYEILQYTGESIPDTDEMIVDGDILEQSYFNKLNKKKIIKRYLIHYENACFKAKRIGHSPYGDTLLYFVIANAKIFDTRIIGNKFENPELLEVDNE
ncbi:YopX family protein [Sedimentibacter sp.]|uniref:YopX family protein n=1 Tax=Sedimentibacter sp. TaxID=1960295 RepID=UPI0028A859B5|nr:YopX family protein [Sedimentibacter sp.]